LHPDNLNGFKGSSLPAGRQGFQGAGGKPEIKETLEPLNPWPLVFQKEWRSITVKSVEGFSTDTSLNSVNSAGNISALT
jgi:hypothetical protein